MGDYVVTDVLRDGSGRVIGGRFLGVVAVAADGPGRVADSADVELARLQVELGAAECVQRIKAHCLDAVSIEPHPKAEDAIAELFRRVESLECAR